MQRFAFLIHPLCSEDIFRKFKAAQYFPAGVITQVMTRIPPMVVSEIKGLKSPYAEAVGNFIAVPLTSEQMIQLPVEFVLKRIIQAGKKAEKLGAKIMGLGAFTSVVGDAGITVARNLNIHVTTGNSLTAATAITGIRQAAQIMEVNLKKATVSVVGASGSIGRAVASILAQDVGRLILVARTESRLEETARLIRDLYGEALTIDYSTDLAGAIRQSDAVLATSSAPEGIIRPEDLKPGAIVCDIARPRDTIEGIAQARDDIFVFDGGVLEVPGDVDFGLNFGFPPGLTYACMAETMILTLEGRFESYSLGREYYPEKITEIHQLAEKHGFQLSALRFNERVIDAQRCAQILGNARKKLAS